MATSLEDLRSIIPDFDKYMKRAYVATYEDFENLLIDDVDEIVEDMQRHRNQHDKDKPEDQITEHILAGLRRKGFDAESDSDYSGHCDIIVKRERFLWLGEAKKHKDYQYLADGFHQLCTRYSTGYSNSKSGGLFMYIHNAKGNNVVLNWKKELEAKTLLGFEDYGDITISDCSANDACFVTTHAHQLTGNAYKVRHIPVFLYHQPKDSSGRTAKKHK